MGYTILLVDDSKAARFMHAKMIEWSGIPVKQLVTAANGEEALDALELYQVDLVITDINMPIMDGYNLITILRNHPDLKKIPVIPLTSLAAKQELEFFKAHGVTHYLTKCTTKEKLKEAMHKVLRIA